MGMTDRVFDVVVPTQEEMEVRDGKRRNVVGFALTTLCPTLLFRDNCQDQLCAFAADEDPARVVRPAAFPECGPERPNLIIQALNLLPVSRGLSGFPPGLRPLQRALILSLRPRVALGLDRVSRARLPLLRRNGHLEAERRDRLVRMPQQVVQIPGAERVR